MAKRSKEKLLLGPTKNFELQQLRIEAKQKKQEEELRRRRAQSRPTRTSQFNQFLAQQALARRKQVATTRRLGFPQSPFPRRQAVRPVYIQPRPRTIHDEIDDAARIVP